MRLLLDTHAFVWFVEDDSNLTIASKNIIHEELSHLPFHHRDPFDRLLVAQAKSENISFISKDKILDKYGIKRTW